MTHAKLATDVRLCVQGPSSMPTSLPTRGPSAGPTQVRLTLFQARVSAYRAENTSRMRQQVVRLSCAVA